MADQLRDGDDKEFLELHAIATGGVQGVGFRNGSLEIYAQGEQERLHHLLVSLRCEFGELVSAIDSTYTAPSVRYQGFRLLR